MEKKEKLEELAVSARKMILGLASSEGITDLTMVISITDGDAGTILVDGDTRFVLKLAASLVSGIANRIKLEESEAE